MTQNARKKRIAVALTDSELSAFASQCARLGVKPTTRLRAVLLESMTANEATRRSIAIPISEHATLKMEVRLTASENDEVAALARSAGLSKSKWIANRVRECLEARTSYVEEPALAALRQSNTSLGAIGRNLNQIARALNSNDSTASITVGAIEGVKLEVLSHIKAVHEVILAAQQRYRIVTVQEQ
jgi:hypothetical protein